MAPWWIDYNTSELVRAPDGRRWPVADVPPLQVAGVIDVVAVDRWVLSQP